MSDAKIFSEGLRELPFQTNLGYFPDPYPDEMLYSVYARLWQQFQCPSARALSFEIFGVPHPVWDLEFPGYLNHLVSVLPAGHSYTADGLIDAHTHLPLYAPFLDPDRTARIRLMLQGTERRGIQFLLGAGHKRMPQTPWLRYCPLCVKTDRAEYGESYWHRVHQVMGVEVCPRHGTWLEASTAPARSLRSCNELQPANTVVTDCRPRFLGLHKPGAVQMSALAQDAEWLLAHPTVMSDPSAVRRRYLALLADQELAAYTGRVKASCLTKAFLQAYPQEWLRRLDGEGESLQSGRGVLALVRQIRASLPPLHHLLLIRFLGHTAESFFQLPDRPDFFGIGPWPCLNPAATHYQELTIKQCVVSMRAEDGNPVGTFRCGCGFVYMRVGPDWSPMVRYHAGRVLEYGPVWDRTLQRYWKDGDMKVDEIADRLGVTPPTVRAQVGRLRLPLRRLPVRDSEPRTHRCQQLQAIPRASEREHQRQEWLRLRGKQAVNPKTLKRKRQLQRWLRRHDREWLSRYGVTRRKGFPAEVPREQINWDQRDQTLVELVHATSQRLREQTGKPQRVTRTSIIREAGELRKMAPNLRHLPRTAQALLVAAETEQAFLQRRAAWAVQQLRRAGHAISVTRVRELMGGRKAWSREAYVCDILEKAMGDT